MALQARWRLVELLQVLGGSDLFYSKYATFRLVPGTLSPVLWNLTHLCFRLVTSMASLDLLADLDVILGRLHWEQNCQDFVLI